MNEQSLLSLLEDEKQLIYDIQWYKKSAEGMLDYVNKDGFDTNSCIRLSREYEKKAEQSEEKLADTRRWIRKYIEFIMEGF